MATALGLLILLAGGVVLLAQSRSHGGDPAAVAAGTATQPASPAPVSPNASPGPSASASPSPGPSSFADLYRQSADGVVRIETTACDQGGVGSGFLVAPDMVATVAHVVDGAVSVVLRQGEGADARTATGTVVGFDRAAELALVRSSEPLDGHVFRLATSLPEVGDDVAAIGYPLAGPQSLTRGTVSGLDRPVTTDTASLTGLLQTDASLNPGNSGGPLLLADGSVAGLVEAKDEGGDNIGYAITAASARQQLEAWQRAPTPVRPAPCASPEPPRGVTAQVTDSSGSSDGPAVAAAFRTYAEGIDRSDYAAAYAVLSPAAQARTSFATFRSGTESSYIPLLDVQSVTRQGGSAVKAEVAFTSLQDPARGGTGQSCSEWQMTYTMAASAGGWRIDVAKPHAGSPAAC